MYLSVYLFNNKPTGPHEVDFIIGNSKKFHVPKRGGGGAIREGFLLQKLTSKWGAY